MACGLFTWFYSLIKTNYPKNIRDLLNKEYREIHRLEKEIKHHKKEIEKIKLLYNNGDIS